MQLMSYGDWPARQPRAIGLGTCDRGLLLSWADRPMQGLVGAMWVRLLGDFQAEVGQCPVEPAG
jgi:hypothetical protein